MTRLRPLALAFGALWLPSASPAATWLVTPDGTGDAPTIQAAVQAATDGDIIELADGTFHGAGNCDFWIYGRELTIRSLSGDPSTCIIDAEGGDGVVRRCLNFQGTSSAFVLQNLTFTGGTALDSGSSTYGGAMLFNADTSPTFTGCVFVGNRAGRGGAIFTYDNCSPTITGCTFVDNTADSYGGAISLTSGCSPVIEDTVFLGNSAGAYGGALNVWNGATPTIVRCTFWGNAAPDGGSTAWCRWGGAPDFASSILAFSAAGAPVTCDASGGAPTFSCCDLFGNAGGDWVDCIAGMEAANGNMSVDPLFCDAGAGDLRLQWGSPCLPAHSGGCGQIGVYGPGNCPSLAVEAAPFGRIKAWYRD